MNEVKKNDLVSVIVTTHNRCTLMKRAVESIQKQSYTYLEIIIIDDNSSDDTEVYANELLKTDDRIRYIKIPQNVSGPQNAKATNAPPQSDHFTWNGFLHQSDRNCSCSDRNEQYPSLLWINFCLWK